MVVLLIRRYRMSDDIDMTSNELGLLQLDMTSNVGYVAFRYMYPGTNEYLFEVLSEGKSEGENFFVCTYPQVSNIWACATK